MSRYIFPRIVAVFCALLGTLILISGISIGLLVFVNNGGSTPSAFEMGLMTREAVNTWFITMVTAAVLYAFAALIQLLIGFAAHTRRNSEVLIDIARMVNYQITLLQTLQQQQQDEPPTNQPTQEINS